MAQMGCRIFVTTCGQSPECISDRIVSELKYLAKLFHGAELNYINSLQVQDISSS